MFRNICISLNNVFEKNNNLNVKRISSYNKNVKDSNHSSPIIKLLKQKNSSKIMKLNN